MTKRKRWLAPPEKVQNSKNGNDKEPVTGSFVVSFVAADYGNSPGPDFVNGEIVLNLKPNFESS